MVLAGRSLNMSPYTYRATLPLTCFVTFSSLAQKMTRSYAAHEAHQSFFFFAACCLIFLRPSLLYLTWCSTEVASVSSCTTLIISLKDVVNLSLSTLWGHVGGAEIQLHSFFTSALDVGQWSTLCLCRFTPGKEPLYPFSSKLGAPQSRSGRFGDENNLIFIMTVKHNYLFIDLLFC